MIQLTRQTIDVPSLAPAVADTRAGGTVVFVGSAREFTHGRQTARLAYDAYESMALKQLNDLADEARNRWPVIDLKIVHRLGVIELGEACVVIVTSCPHRRDAFEATSWLMDRIKEVVPIWKQENWVDGSAEWVHDSSRRPAQANDGV